MIVAKRRVTELLGELFSPEELRMFLVAVGNGERVEALGTAGTLDALQREGRLDEAFFAALVATFPERRGEIEALYEEVGAVLVEPPSRGGGREPVAIGLEAAAGRDVRVDAALRVATVDEADVAPDRRVVNVHVDREGAPARLPLPAGVPHRLRIGVGPPEAGSTVTAPADLPPEVLEAARRSPVQLDVVVLSATCSIDGHAPAGREWARRVYRLGLGPDGRSPTLEVPFVPLADGFLRVILSWRGQVLQSLRTGVRVGGGAGRVVTRVEFAVSTALRDLEALPSRRVALTLNDVDGRHAVAVVAPGVDGAEVEAAGAEPAFFAEQVPLLRDLVEGLAKDPVTRMYRYAADNQGDRASLEAFLLALGPQGALTWRTLFTRPAGELLRARLAASDAAIQVAALASGEAVPWGFLYDLPLRDDPARACLTALDAGPPDGLLPWEACRARPDCPLAGPEADRVVCPWGFWGFKHRIEEPPMRVDGAPGRELVHEVPVEGEVHAVMGVNRTLDRDGAHAQAVRALPGTRVVVAGDDPAVPGPDALQAALRDPGLHLVYLYCHGGVGMGPNKNRVWLSVGGSLEERFAPDTLRYWPLAWSSTPLVVVNGCNTVRVDPTQLANFVREFAAHGAAGVVGTETTVWEVLAREVGRRLLGDLVAGQPLGQALRRMRHGLLRERYNPLGLVYSAYASVDLRLVRR